MEQGRCMDYLQCFLDVDNFHRHFSNLGSGYDHQVAQQDAMIIYDKYDDDDDDYDDDDGGGGGGDDIQLN